MLTEDSPNWSGRENLHSVKSYGHPLGVTRADWGLCEDAAFLCMSGLGQALRPLARKLLQRAALGGVEPTKGNSFAFPDRADSFVSSPLDASVESTSGQMPGPRLPLCFR
jgi:hypothetical protein